MTPRIQRLGTRQQARAVPLMLTLLLVLGAGCNQGSSDYFGKIAPAEGQVFRFNNGAEPETLDPQLMTGQPDGRIAWALFEGLTSYHPETLQPVPGAAESWEVTEEGKRYTFKIRKDARWSNGDALTSEDFLYSWRRFLTPETAAQYSYLIYSIRNSEAFYNGWHVGELRLEQLLRSGVPMPVDPGSDRVDIVLQSEIDEDGAPTGNWVGSFEFSPEGMPVRGTLVVEPDGRIRVELTGELVDVQGPEEVSLQGTGQLQADQKAGTFQGQFSAGDGGFQLNLSLESHVARAEDIGISAPDPQTFVVDLAYPVQYFLALAAFYPLSPVHQGSIEEHGKLWTKPQNIVSNGAFRLVEHSLQDQIVMLRSETYWDKENVKLERVHAYPVETYQTGCDLYEAGMIDLEPSNYIPIYYISYLTQKKDYHIHPYLGVYFYRVNVTHPVLKDKRVRRALALAIDRQALVEFLRAGQAPANQFVPGGMAGYQSPEGKLGYDLEEAKRLLAEAGYPDGKDFPKMDILYNTTELHKSIAEIIQRMWKEKLGIPVGLRNEEWKVYLKSQRTLDYEISRSGWIGDYADPNTFLDMFLTGGGNNNTGWASPLYDRLINEAAREEDHVKRMELFHEAESHLLDELPIIPLYIYTTYYLKKPYVRGFYSNIQDVHPLKYIWIDHDWDKKEQD